jgi:Kringle domain
MAPEWNKSKLGSADLVEPRDNNEAEEGSENGASREREHDQNVARLPQKRSGEKQDDEEGSTGAMEAKMPSRPSENLVPTYPGHGLAKYGKESCAVGVSADDPNTRFSFIEPDRATRSNMDNNGDLAVANSPNHADHGRVGAVSVWFAQDDTDTAGGAMAAESVDVHAAGDADNSRGPHGAEPEMFPQNPHATPTPNNEGDTMLSATLVDDEAVVEAERAPEGCEALAQNKKFKYLILGILLVFLAVIIPVATVVPKNQSTTIVQTSVLVCGTARTRQADYRGTINVTEAGIPCQPWASQFPNSHSYTAEKFPDADLSENYC